jgi:hypothetical protein
MLPTAPAAAPLLLQDSVLDPDLHDTFGAHPFFEGPAARARATHRHLQSHSGGTSPAAPEALAAAQAAAALLARADDGSGSGWRQPLGTPRRPPLPAGAGAAAAAAAAAGERLPSPTGVAAAAAAAAPVAAAGELAGAPTPKVYQPRPLAEPIAVSSAEGAASNAPALMLDPTNVPGQHSITVHDPQASWPVGCAPTAGCTLVAPYTLVCCTQHAPLGLPPAVLHPPPCPGWH